MITLTEKAIEKVKEISDSEGIGHYCIRVGLLGKGCQGLSTNLVFEDLIRETDEVFEHGEVKVIIDPVSLNYMDGCSIDYVSSLMENGFKFNDLKTKSTCGCGKSMDF